MMIRRLAFAAVVAGGLLACNDSGTEPTQVPAAALSAKLTSLPGDVVVPTFSCSAVSPTDQITQVLATISASNLSADVKATITESLQAALTALGDRDLTAAASAVQSAIGQVEASRAPQPVKDRLVDVLSCVLSQITA
jgi:hypothetical protein